MHSSHVDLERMRIDSSRPGLPFFPFFPPLLGLGAAALLTSITYQYMTITMEPAPIMKVVSTLSVFSNARCSSAYSDLTHCRRCGVVSKKG